MNSAFEQLKQLFARGHYREALHMSEYLLTSTIAPSDQRFLYYVCTMCARYMADDTQIIYYFERYEASMTTSTSMLEKARFAHVHMILLFDAKQDEQALQLSAQLLTTTRSKTEHTDFIYMYASTLHHKLLYYLSTGQYRNAVMIYNELDAKVLKTIATSVPILSLQIHDHLTSAYLRLAQWQTAYEIIQSILQMPLLQQSTQADAHLHIRKNLVSTVLYGATLDVAENDRLFLNCQPMSHIALTILLDDVLAITKASPQLKPLYEKWSAYRKKQRI